MPTASAGDKKKYQKTAIQEAIHAQFKPKSLIINGFGMESKRRMMLHTINGTHTQWIALFVEFW